MNTTEHHEKAEQLLSDAHEEPDSIRRTQILAEAQVHATLALSAPAGTGPAGSGQFEAGSTESTGIEHSGASGDGSQVQGWLGGDAPGELKLRGRLRDRIILSISNGAIDWDAVIVPDTSLGPGVWPGRETTDPLRGSSSQPDPNVPPSRLGPSRRLPEPAPDDPAKQEPGPTGPRPAPGDLEKRGPGGPTPSF